MHKSKDYKNTYQSILTSAKTLFLEKGFQGASISDIANHAEINKSLIYYHFDNKEKLWKAVKEYILSMASINQDSLRPKHTDTLSGLLTDILSSRFKLYLDQPDLIRLMKWQSLEDKEENLAGISHRSQESITDFTKDISKLQRNGQMRKDLSPEAINTMILALSTTLFLNPNFTDSLHNNADLYKNLIFKALVSVLEE